MHPSKPSENSVSSALQITLPGLMSHIIPPSAASYPSWNQLAQGNTQQCHNQHDTTTLFLELHLALVQFSKRKYNMIEHVTWENLQVIHPVPWSPGNALIRSWACLLQLLANVGILAEFKSTYKHVPTNTIPIMQGKLPDKWHDKTNYKSKVGTYKLPQISAGEMYNLSAKRKLT